MFFRGQMEPDARGIDTPEPELAGKKRKRVNPEKYYR
jgi:hypothetical protein